MDASDGLDLWGLATGELLSETTSHLPTFYSHSDTLPAVPFHTAASESVGAEEEVSQLCIDQFCSHLTSSEDADSRAAHSQLQRASDQHAQDTNEISLAAADTYQDFCLQHDFVLKQKHERSPNELLDQGSNVQAKFGASELDTDFSCSEELYSYPVNEIDTELLLASISSEEPDGHEAEGSQCTSTNCNPVECSASFKQIQQTCHYEAQKMYLEFAKRYSRDCSQKLPGDEPQGKTKTSFEQHSVSDIDLECAQSNQEPPKPVKNLVIRSPNPPKCRRPSPGKENIAGTSVRNGSSVSNIAPAVLQIKRPLMDSNFSRRQSHPKCDKKDSGSDITLQSLCFVKSEKDSADLNSVNTSKDGWICPRAGKRPPRNASKQRLLDSWLSRTTR
ncbi:hypothetical protein O6H91_01G154400 [Diphasiastrum complanatum]|uniref:Uncharacterized protein n=1 Tax=Diphasiastrum complanatum TaxID=34168 RepID=A0ACC2EXJ8_DIPCM|nr:hypothetical protein O6H91_Y071500 [Diphasiastrum complanatum]KAJ7571194.1 hypothetical protein O6H91_01G154400 [Diphasiastrum complanatum]